MADPHPGEKHTDCLWWELLKGFEWLLDFGVWGILPPGQILVWQEAQSYQLTRAPGKGKNGVKCCLSLRLLTTIREAWSRTLLRLAILLMAHWRTLTFSDLAQGSRA